MEGFKRYRNCIKGMDVMAKKTNFDQFRLFVFTNTLCIATKTRIVNQYSYFGSEEGYIIDYTDRYHFIPTKLFEEVYRDYDTSGFMTFDEEIEELKVFKNNMKKG